jgi:flagellar biosynthesis protein FliP
MKAKWITPISMFLLQTLFAQGQAAITEPVQQALAHPSQAPNGLPWGIVVLLTVLTLLPAILLSMTPFVRLLVVFHFLRQALGTQSTPSNQTLVGLALVLTYFLMQPVGNDIHKLAVKPFQSGKLTAMQAVEKGAEPLRKFMLRYAREKDLALFVEISKQPRPKNPDDLPISAVAPAYILSELRAGFQIGAVLFLPFVVIDLVVASITTSVGMLQLPPVVISTPLKILLFVMVDGWNLVIGSQMISVANTTFRGSYLFAGTASDQPAFSQATDGTVRYEGNEEVNYCRIGENRSIASNVPGDRLFDAGAASIFSALNSLITSLENDDAGSVAEATSDIRRSFDNLNAERVFYGNAISRLEANNSQLDAKKLDLEENEERLVGADLAETVTSLSQAQTAIQAILTASGKMSKLSLLDYLQ